MCSNITTQHIEDLKLVSALSIAFEESCDINETAQASLFARFMSNPSPKEEFLGLLPLKGQTRGEDIANAVIECMDKHHIPLDKILSISTDGAKSMTGKRFVRKTFQDEICKVMEFVIDIINSILSKALSHRQFKEFLFEMESEYADVLLHNKVRWLSIGNVLKHFASLFSEIKAFLLEKGVHYPELTDDQWIQDFYFMVDVTSRLHQLNLNGDRYRALITNFFIPELNNHDVQELWFQQDGATCHTARATIDLLKDTFGDRLISRFGPVNWQQDYFLWGYVKSLVYADKPQTLDHLEDNICRVISDIRPQMLEKVIENWTSRLDYIRASRGSHMPEIIFKM
ncbi:general transcription factor II-I repeat domain-containing protein 2 [Trichonephila clavipes]|uniref:General transcription factor II-I repeat domain-containing protein 2 n=1 Tax=Trichonephila clavipes TaxID=2585209 RepID=A0A8X6V551_TRICX|nr:general transcription factor II-I repeat domain-containing protein 2 [Trichonephila clavipes]